MEIPGYEKLCARNRDEDKDMYFLLYHSCLSATLSSTAKAVSPKKSMVRVRGSEFHVVLGSEGRAQGVEAAAVLRIYSWSDHGFRLAPPSLSSDENSAES